MLFLFHAKEDKEIAEIIIKKLAFQHEEVSIWIENDNFLPSPERAAAIVSAIEDSGFQVLLFSKKSYSKRGDLLREYDFILTAIKQRPDKRQTLIPIRIDDCFLPAQLQNDHFYNLFEEGGLERVARYIHPDPDPDDSEQHRHIENAFYKNNWEWIIRYEGLEMTGKHKYEAGFTYLHYILASKLNMISINSLKKVTTRLHQPARHTLLGLTEDGEDEPEEPEWRKPEVERRADVELFSKIRDEIIYAIQSIQIPDIQRYFLQSVRFYNHHYVFFNRYWMGQPMHWKLYLME